MPRLLSPPQLGRGILGLAGPTFPLAVSSNGRYLQTSGGVPFLLNGESAWNLIVQPSLANVDTYLADRRSRGCNAVLAQVIGVMQTSPPGAQAAGASTPFTTAGDFTTPRASYFAHAKTVIDKCASAGIVVFLTPCYLGYPAEDQGWQSEILGNSTGNCTTYGNYLATTFAACPNIVWVAGGDNYESAYRTRTNAIMQALKTNAPQHLRTSHWQRFSLATDILGVSSSYDWNTVNSFYTDESVFTQAAADAYAVSPTMPAFQIENRYSDITPFPTSKDLREFCFAAWLAGGTCGPGFSGRGNVWQFGSNFADFGLANADWQAALGDADDAMFVGAAAVAAGRAWHLLAPAASLVTSGRGTIGTVGYVAAAKTADSTLAIIYCPSGASITVDLTLMAGSGAVTSRWYDPTTGAITAATGSPIAQASHVFNASSQIGNNAGGASDWFLVLET